MAKSTPVTLLEANQRWTPSQLPYFNLALANNQFGKGWRAAVSGMYWDRHSEECGIPWVKILASLVEKINGNREPVKMTMVTVGNNLTSLREWQGRKGSA